MHYTALIIMNYNIIEPNLIEKFYSEIVQIYSRMFP